MNNSFHSKVWLQQAVSPRQMIMKKKSKLSATSEKSSPTSLMKSQMGNQDERD